MTVLKKRNYDTKVEEFKNVVKESLKELGLNNRTRKSIDNQGVWVFDSRFPCGAFIDITFYVAFAEDGREWTKCQIATMFNIEGYDKKSMELLSKIDGRLKLC